MGPFDSDFFGGGIEDFFNRAFRGGRSRDSASGSDELLETVHVPKGTFFIFDFSNRKVSSVEVVDGLEENEYGEEVSTGRKMLEVRFSGGETASYRLPKQFKKGKLEWKYTNGILEVFLGR